MSINFNFSSKDTKPRTNNSVVMSLGTIEKNSEIFSKESERLKEMYHTLTSHHINEIFREQISEFYESFSTHLDRILLENKELKQMLKALYRLHMTKAKDKGETGGEGKENWEENFMTKKKKKSDFGRFKADLQRKYKAELMHVRETMGNQIRKLENELEVNLRMMKKFQRKNKQKIKGLEIDRKSFEGRMQETAEIEIEFVKESMKKEHFKEKSKILENFEKRIKELGNDRDGEVKELRHEVGTLKKKLEISKIEVENLKLKLDGSNDRLDLKIGMVENLRKEIKDKDGSIEDLRNQLRRSKRVIDRQTAEVQKLIKELQERKIEIKDGLRLDMGDIQDRIQLQQEIVDKLQTENEQLREKNDLEISMIKKEFERRVLKIREKAGLMMEREEKVEVRLVS